jgi:hypothetical protein
MMITRDRLIAMDEAQLRRDVLVPLFREMGFKDVFEYHGQAMEQGKDIVMWNADPAGTRLNYVAVVKAKPISGQVSGKGGAGEVCVQVHQSLGSPYVDPQGQQRIADRCFIVCPHQIKKEALAALQSCIGAAFSKVAILAGDQLWEKIDTHLAERALLDKANELRRRLVDSHIENARIIIDAQNVHVHLLPRAEGAEELRAVFQFPPDERGRAAFEALQRHIDTGEPVTIDGKYVVEWRAPDTMGRLFGEERPSKIEIGPSETPEILLNVEVSSHSRTVRMDNVPFKGQAGRDRLQLHSVLAGLPLEVSLTFVQSERRFNITVHTRLEGRNVKQQLEGLKIQDALVAGGVLRIELAATGQVVAERSFEPGLFGAENLQLLPFAEKVSAIQVATNALLSIPEVMSRDDLHTVDLLTRVIGGESVERAFDSVGVKLTRPGAERVLADFSAGAPLDFTMSSEDEFELWGVRIPVGQVVRQLKGLTLTADARRSLEEALASDAEGPFDVTFSAGTAGAVETAYFLRWRPDDEASAWRAVLPKGADVPPGSTLAKDASPDTTGS